MSKCRKDLSDAEIRERLKAGADVNAPVNECFGKTFLMMVHSADWRG